MADIGRTWTFERDIEQAITALKKGAHLLKYSRKGKPRFCPFRLSNDERSLIWLSGKEEMQLNLSSVVRIIPGQRTTTFQRNPTPEKEYQSFSLIYGHDEQSLDLVCKDKDQAELWFVGLKALINNNQSHKLRVDTKSDGVFSSDGNSPITLTRKKYVGGGVVSYASSLQDFGDAYRSIYGSPPHRGFDKINMPTAMNLLESRNSYPDGGSLRDSVNSVDSDIVSEASKIHFKDSNSEAFRVSLSSMISSSSHGSGQDDVDALGDVYMWGEGIGDGLLGGGLRRSESAFSAKMDSLLPKHLESTVVLDVHSIACGRRHAALVNRQGEVFCWGEESGGRLGHGVDSDVPHPQLVEALANTYVEQVACGEYHTCAVTLSGDLYTWGDGTKGFGLLGQGNDFSNWIPRKINLSDGIRISSVACGPWHTALITSAGQLFTFGDGTFGALGHGDKASSCYPKEVESLKGLKTIKVACGVWHTAAIVEVIMGYSEANACPSGKLFTWGDADKGRLGHGDKEQKMVPTCVAALVDYDFCQVRCGHSLTVALTTSGTVYTMGHKVYGQLGDPSANGHHPVHVKGPIEKEFIEEISCGSHHVAVLTSRAEVYTWGKGANGRLGHGDVQDRHTPTLVEALKDKQVKSMSCGPSFTAAVCLHKWLSGADQSICSGCRLSFGFTRKRHNCYNCGHVFCHSCSSKKATRATLAPTPKKPYRVCDPCYTKLKAAADGGMGSRNGQVKKNTAVQQSLDSKGPAERGEMKQLKVQLSLPRFPSIEQSRQNEDKSPSIKMSKKPESLRRVSPAPSESGLWYDTDSSCKYPVSPMSAPPSRILSSAISPLPRRLSPPATPPISSLSSSDYIFEDLKKTNRNLTQEVLKLQSQVESLSQHCQAQKAQLQQYAKELQIANAIASEEASKCKAAKEVIRCLTMQLKDLAEKLPSQVSDHGGMSAPLSPLSDTMPFANVASPIHSIGIPEVEGVCFRDQKFNGNPPIRVVRDFDSNGGINPYATPNVALHLPQRMVSPRGIFENEDVENLADVFSGSKSLDENLSEGSHKDSDTPNGRYSHPPSDADHPQQNYETEWVKQHEPGVYITFTSLPGGGKDLKRVRFSRKKFSEKQAEQWWAENRSLVYEMYNVRVNNVA